MTKEKRDMARLPSGGDDKMSESANIFPHLVTNSPIMLRNTLRVNKR